MIYEQHHPEHDISLFNNPEQLLLLRDNLTQLIRRKQNGKDDNFISCHSHSPNPQQSEDHQTQSVSQLLRIQQQHQELVADLSSQISTLGQISIKMIDYITDMQQKRTDQVLHYEDSIQNLKAQLESATHKNHLIQGDIEMFRERLMVAQQEMEEIQRNQPTPGYEQESENKIEQLQRQLQKIKEQLAANKTQQPNKQSDIAASHRGLNYINSEKYIGIRTPPAVILSDHFLQVEEIEQLNQRIKELEQQNYQLRYEIECLQNSQYHHTQQQIRDFEDNLINPFAEQRETEINIQVLQDYADHTINKVISSTVLVQPRRQKPEMAHNMVSYQSVEKFHTLSNEWSTKSLQNMMMFNMESMQDKLIYLNQQQRNCIPQTRQTQNSQPDTDINFKQCIRYYNEIGVNTDQPEQTQRYDPQHQQEHIRSDVIQEGGKISPLNKTVRRLVDGFWNLKTRVVDNRISKVAHQPRTHHKRNISYY